MGVAMRIISGLVFVSGIVTTGLMHFYKGDKIGTTTKELGTILASTVG